MPGEVEDERQWVSWYGKGCEVTGTLVMRKWGRNGLIVGLGMQVKKKKTKTNQEHGG